MAVFNEKRTCKPMFAVVGVVHVDSDNTAVVKCRDTVKDGMVFHIFHKGLIAYKYKKIYSFPLRR